MVQQKLNFGFRPLERRYGKLNLTPNRQQQLNSVENISIVKEYPFRGVDGEIQVGIAEAAIYSEDSGCFEAKRITLDKAQQYTALVINAFV